MWLLSLLAAWWEYKGIMGRMNNAGKWPTKMVKISVSTGIELQSGKYSISSANSRKLLQNV